MDGQITIEDILTWLAAGGAGAFLSWFVEKLAGAIPSFAEWWKALTDQMRQGLVFIGGVVLSMIIYVILAFSNLVSWPVDLLAWINLLLPIVTASFATSQLVFGQILKRNR